MLDPPPISVGAGSTGASIRIYLVEGTPDGLRLVEKSNWTGLGIVCPRTRYADARKRPEFGRPGVYILVGPGDTALPRVYVGEADELRTRLDSHQQNKDFWTRVVAFTSKDENINKAHVRYLESRLIGLAATAKRAEVGNGNSPVVPALSEADTADMENFLREMLLILPLLEVTAFQLSGTSRRGGADGQNTPLRADLHLRGPLTEATGTDTTEGFIVSAGSKGRAKAVPSVHQWLLNIRESLLSEGILAIDGDHVVLTQDYSFVSPSSAAGVLLGRAANGRTEWKNNEGKTLKQLQIEALHRTAPLPDAPNTSA